MVIGMRMRDDGVADRRRIEPELLQPTGDLVFDRVVEQRVDQDDALRRRHSPCGVFALADEVEVVEDLHGLRVPGRAVGCRGDLASAAGASSPRSAAATAGTT